MASARPLVIGHWALVIPPRAARRRASVIVIVMMSLLFATFALLAFMERASNDLLVDQREVLARRMRKEAYSSLEVTLAVLNQFREVGSGLHSPAEGWTTPLDFAGYTPADDRKVEISFDDESGKSSLPRATAPVLTNLFKNWQIPQQDAEVLADALMGWMHANHTYSTSLSPDYEMSSPSYLPPLRPIRSYSELAAIDKVRETFYDEQGRPNDYYRRFTESVSLFDFPKPNINGAKPDTLAALGQFDPTQQQNIGEYLRGEGQYQYKGPAYFENANEVSRIATGNTGDTAQFSSTISALRINVLVMDGKTEFRLSAVVAPPGGAQMVTTNATSQRAQTSASAQRSGQAQASATTQNPNPNANRATQGQNAGDRNLKYPFTLLEIRENDTPPPAAPPAAQ